MLGFMIKNLKVVVVIMIIRKWIVVVFKNYGLKMMANVVYVVKHGKLLILINFILFIIVIIFMEKKGMNLKILKKEAKNILEKL